MSQQNYSVEIISHHPTFKNKSLRKYYVDGIETVGAWGDEAFEIRFTNHTWQPVQVKVSLDGTDILTGKVADTKASNDMWYVRGYGNLSLKAWPETANGGAQFVFTSANNSVAVHTHGDMSSRGIIAVAVYVEGHVEPIKLSPVVIKEEHHHHYPYRRRRSIYDYDYAFGGGATYSCSDIRLNDGTKGATLGDSDISESDTLGFADSLSRGLDSETVTTCNAGPAAASAATKSLESLVSVGAGQHVDQKLTYVSGLKKPVFTETVRVRYLWWDELVAKLRENNVPAAHASGFPGDKQQVMSLGKTPRIGAFGKAFPREKPAPVPVQAYMRV
jgi:hypothetical protein